MTRKPLQRLLCWMNMHPKLDVIQTFGSAQHIGCPYCRREYGIHYGVEAVIPWTPDLAAMYRLIGYDVDEPTARWRRYRP